MSTEQPFTWTILDFFNQDCPTGEFLSSFSFTSNNGELKWRLRLYPKGSTDELRDHVSVFAQLLSCPGRSEVRAKFRLALLGCNGEELLVVPSKASDFTLHSVLGLNRFVKRRTLRKAKSTLVPNGRLVVQCHVNASDHAGVPLSSPHSQPPPSVFRLIEDLSLLLCNAEFSDVSLRINEHLFPAHRTILAARSPYFRVLLDVNARKNQPNDEPAVLDVPVNVEAEVFAETMRFVYTGRCGARARSMARDLLVAANTFGLEDLKDLCAGYLRDSLGVENSVEMALFAAQHQSHGLKASVVEFIRENLANGKSEDIARSLTVFLERFDGFA